LEKIIVGLLGVLLGILINEYFRRNARIEKYSEVIFDKRLSIYENFFKELSKASSLVTELLDVTNLNIDEKKEIAFHAGLKLLEYTEEHKFYINEEITIYCSMVFIEASNIFEEQIDEAKLADFRQGVMDASLMIRSESGLTEMDDFFKTITKSTPGGKLIEGYRAIKKHHEKNKA
jgi:hypothetical protein